MYFSIPVHYLYNEAERCITDLDLFKAMESDFGCFDAHNFEGEIETVDDFVSKMGEHLPEGEHYVDDGIFTATIDDYYGNSFYYLVQYCIKNKIPINYIEESEYGSDQCYIGFYRPGMDDEQLVPVNASKHPLIEMNVIMDIINNSDEALSDAEIMMKVSHLLEKCHPNSEKNKLINWAIPV